MNQDQWDSKSKPVSNKTRLRRCSLLVATIGLGVVGLLFSPEPARAAAPPVELVSVDDGGAQHPHDSFQQTISADGRLIAFQSSAPLAQGTSSGLGGIFVRDRISRTTSLVTPGMCGQANAGSVNPVISGNGRYIAFESSASNLVECAPPGTYGSQIWVRDLLTGTTRLASTNAQGVPANSWSEEPAISADGTKIVFSSNATNLTADGNSGSRRQVFHRDLVAGTTTLVSMGTSGGAGNGLSEDPDISADGSAVAFTSFATDLSASDLNQASDVFVRNISTGNTTIVSKTSAGAPALGHSYLPSLSAHGRYIAYTSEAANLVAGDVNGVRDVFVFDSVTGQVSLVSSGLDNVTGNSASAGGDISADNKPGSVVDGRYVAFQSSATNLVPGGTSGTQLFLRDLINGETSVLSSNAFGSLANGDSEGVDLSSDARFAVFYSRATNLVAGDTNGHTDVFVRDRGELNAPTIPSLTATPDPFSSTVPVTLRVMIEDDTPDIAWSMTMSDAGGAEVRTFSGISPGLSGIAQVQWDGRDSTGATLPDGPYSVRVRATDGWANATSQTISLTLRNAGPTVGIVKALPNPFSPNGDGVKDETTLSVNLIDPASPIAWKVSVRDPAGLVVRTFESAGSAATNVTASHVWDGKDAGGESLPAGDYIVEVKATNALGSSSIRTTFVKIDLQAPSVALSSHASGAIVSGDASLTALAADENGVATVAYFYRSLYDDGAFGSWKQLGVGTGASWSLVLRSLSLSSGRVELSVMATDLAGNSTGLMPGLPVVISNAEELGRLQSQSYWDLPVSQSTGLGVNRYSGNLLVHVNLSSVESPGLREALALSYNSRARTVSGVGYGWSLNSVAKIVFGPGSAVVRLGSGRLVVFSKNPDGSFSAPPGEFMDLELSSGMPVLTDKKGYQWRFALGGRLDSVTGVWGDSLAFTYDSDDRLIEIASPENRKAQFLYSGADRLGEIVDSSGRRSRFTYDASGNLASVHTPRQGTISLVYDQDHKLKALINERGTRFDIDYWASDSRDWVSAIRYAGLTTGFDYGSQETGSRVTIDELGARWTYGFNAAGDLISSRDPLGGVIRLARDSSRLMTQSTDQLGHTEMWEFDVSGNSTLYRDKLGNEWRFTFDSNNNMTSFIDPAGGWA